TDNLSDITLLFALIWNKTSKTAAQDLRTQLRRIDSTLRTGASDVVKAEAATGLRGILQRSSDSDVFGHPIAVKGESVFETRDCPDKQLRRLDLAIHFPGLILAWRNVDNNNTSIPTRATELSKVIRKGHRELLPCTYLHKDIVPPAI
ncbi:uncharacterized protein LY79DRAFT_531416, partial [Colletotrichum navitas]